MRHISHLSEPVELISLYDQLLHLLVHLLIRVPPLPNFIRKSYKTFRVNPSLIPLQMKSKQEMVLFHNLPDHQTFLKPQVIEPQIEMSEPVFEETEFEGRSNPCGILGWGSKTEEVPGEVEGSELHGVGDDAEKVD